MGTGYVCTDFEFRMWSFRFSSNTSDKTHESEPEPSQLDVATSMFDMTGSGSREQFGEGVEVELIYPIIRPSPLPMSL